MKHFFFAGILLISLVGCTSAPTATDQLPPPTAEVRVEVTEETPVESAPDSEIGGEVIIWLDWTPTELDGLNQVIEAFRGRYPDIRFSISYRPQESLLDDFLEVADTDHRPTILLGPSPWGPWLLEQELVQDLSPYVDAQLEQTIIPLAWTQAKTGRSIHGVPLELHGNVLFRNSSLVPERLRTMDELIFEAKASREARGVIQPVDLGFYLATAFMTTCGGNLFAPSGTPDLLNEASVCWMNLLKDLSGTGRVVFNEDVDQDLFKTGETSWYMGGSNQTTQLVLELGEGNVSIDRWPLYEATNRSLTGYVWTENAYLISGTEGINLEASWGFMRFLVTSEAQDILSDPDGAGHLPVLFDAQVPDRLKSEALTAIRSGVPLPLRTDIDVFILPVENAVEDYVVQGADMTFSLEVAIEEIEKTRNTE